MPTLEELALSLAQKHTNAENLALRYGLKHISGGTPMSRYEGNSWVVYLPQEFSDEAVGLVGLSHEFAHLLHNLLSNDAYVSRGVGDITKAFGIRQTEEERKRLMLDNAKRLSWEEGVALRVSERSLADYFVMSKRGPASVARKVMEMTTDGRDLDILERMAIEAAAFVERGVSVEYATVQAMRSIILEHYAYIIGYFGVRDISDQTFYNLLRRQDAHKGASLLWNRNISGSERHELQSVIGRSDKKIKAIVESRGLSFDPFLEVKAMLLSKLFK